MVNQDPKLFYVSGLFSITFFLLVLFGALTYAYHQNRTMQIRTDKEPTPVTIDLQQFVEKQKPIVKPEPKPIVKPEPKPIVKPEPKPIEKPEPKPIVKPEPKPVEKPEPKPIVKPEPKPIEKPEPKPIEKPEPKPVEKPEQEPQSLNSLFSKVDTSKFKDTNNSNRSQQSQPQKQKVSNETISKLKESASQTSSVSVESRIEEDTSQKYKVERTYSYTGTALKLNYEDVEITKSNLQTADQGEYDEFFSNVKKFLYEKWQPSQGVVGNSGIVKITINENSVLEYYRIVTRGKSEDFNAELEFYLSSLKGKTVPTKVKKSVTFEVKFKAKE